MFINVFVGGTFDEFHAGHKSLLLRAFGTGEKVTVGLTSDRYVAKYKHGKHRSFAERQKTLTDWTTENGLSERTEIIAIDDPYEPAATASYHAIIVTGENKIRADEINAMRLSRELSPLSVIEAPIITAEDGMPISSTRVREGEIDRTGHLIMPDALRTTLAKPIGALHTGADIRRCLASRKESLIVAVGDVTVKTLLDFGIVPALSVLDLAVRRKPFQRFEDYHFPESVVKVEIASGPGYISRDARNAISDWGKDILVNKDAKTAIIVKGEEDLLALPVIVEAPLGSIVYYGQPPLKLRETHEDVLSNEEIVENIRTNEGLVEVVVTEDTKKKAQAILERFQ